MHGMNDEVDMRRYGALRAVMPITFVTFFAGYLAIIGIPPFSGFFTKDKIIEAAFDKGGTEGWILGSVALIGAGITAFYMTRMVAMTFFGEKRWAEDAHPHESPTIDDGADDPPGGRSVVAGVPRARTTGCSNCLAPGGRRPRSDRGAISTVALTAGHPRRWSWPSAAGRLVRSTACGRCRGPPPVDVTRSPRPPARDLYGDAFNEAVFMRPGQYLTRFLVCFDNRVIDGAVNGLAALVGGLSAAAAGCRPASPARTRCPCSSARPSWSSLSSW